MSLIKSLLPGLCIVFSLSAHASSLEQFLSSTETIKAKFEQRVLDEDGVVIDTSDGVFYLSRPGKFRWNYWLDDQQIGQQIVANGKSIFVYDPDLEQVTVRDFDNALAQVPSLLLAHSGNNLSDFFVVKEEPEEKHDGIVSVVLTPKADEASYQELKIVLKNQDLSAIYLLDGLGNVTELQFSEMQKNTQIDSSLFEFNVPKGADVLSE